MDRYAGPVAADLAFAGWDLVELYQAGRYRYLLALIDHLPRTSNYVAAMAQDDELAAALADRPPGRPEPPALTEWTPEREVLAAIYNRLGELLAITPTNHPSGKGKAIRGVKPMPMPVTALDRVKARRVKEEVDDMASKLWPEGG